MFNNRFKVTQENILKHVSQEEIFEAFFQKVEFNKKVRNSHRVDDDNPGCYFYYNHNKLRFRDPAIGLNEDCFGIIMKIYGTNYPEALEEVCIRFGLISSNVRRTPTIPLDRKRAGLDKQTVIYPFFRLDTNKKAIWKPEELKYWEDYFVTPEILEEVGIYPIDRYRVNGNTKHIYDSRVPTFCYVNGDKTYKIYHPTKPKNEGRFISNTKVLDGYYQLPETGELLVITKARKDRACLRIFNIWSVAPQAETNYINDEILDDLDNRFDRIVVLFDFDYAGILGANRLKRRRGYDCLFFTDGRFYTDDYKAKDFSDFLKDNGKEKTQYLIDYVKEELIL